MVDTQLPWERFRGVALLEEVGPRGGGGDFCIPVAEVSPQLAVLLPCLCSAIKDSNPLKQQQQQKESN